MNLVLNGIYYKDRHDVQWLDITKWTPSHLTSIMSLNSNLYLTLVNKEENEKGELVDKKYTLNYSLLFLETIIGQLLTWDEVKDNLTDVLIKSYSVDFNLPNNPKRSLLIHQLLNNNEYEISYTSIGNHTDRNIKSRMWKLKDIVISKTDTLTNHTNFKNCIVSINGIISKCLEFENELYIKDGLTYMYNSTSTRHPSITMLDFNELGNIELVSFSECTAKYKNYTGNHTAYTDIEFIFDKKYNLNNKTVFLVLGYSLFFPEHLNITSDRSLVLSPYKLPLSSCLLKVLSYQEKFISNTSIMDTKHSIINYIKDTMFDKNHYGAFFIILDNNDITIRKQLLGEYVYSEKCSPVKQDGFLYDATTSSIIDYTKIEYTTNSSIYYTKHSSIVPLYTGETDTKNLYALETIKCEEAVNNTYNLNNGTHYLITIY